MKTDGNAIKCDLRPIGLTVDAGMIVASVVGGPTSGYSFPRDASEVEANARLIAAAPGLLEANVAAFETRKQNSDGTWSISDRSMKLIERAIAKATQP